MFIDMPLDMHHLFITLKNTIIIVSTNFDQPIQIYDFEPTSVIDKRTDNVTNTPLP